MEEGPVIEQADAVIHHGNNISFTECLDYGKPAITMPYCRDGHDTAMAKRLLDGLLAGSG